MSSKKIFIIIFVFSFLGCSKTFDEKDLYIDKLVYRKSDSTLFTGRLKVLGEASYYYKNFCKGMPCGEWGENENSGGVVHKGIYLDKDILSGPTQKLIGVNIFLINHWQESELPTITYPPFFSIIILKDDKFFESDKKQYDDYINQLSNAVQNDTRRLKYDYIKIIFVNAVHDWSKDYSKEYELVGGKLKETSSE